jgi:DNA polymerase-4
MHLPCPFNLYPIFTSAFLAWQTTPVYPSNMKVKFSGYHQITRSKTVLASISELSRSFEIAKALFESIDLENRSIRLLGISLSNVDNAKQTQVIQLPLFENAGIIF